MHNIMAFCSIKFEKDLAVTLGAKKGVLKIIKEWGYMMNIL